MAKNATKLLVLNRLYILIPIVFLMFFSKPIWGLDKHFKKKKYTESYTKPNLNPKTIDSILFLAQSVDTMRIDEFFISDSRGLLTKSEAQINKNGQSLVLADVTKTIYLVYDKQNSIQIVTETNSKGTRNTYFDDKGHVMYRNIFTKVYIDEQLAYEIVEEFYKNTILLKRNYSLFDKYKNKMLHCDKKINRPFFDDFYWLKEFFKIHKMQ